MQRLVLVATLALASIGSAAVAQQQTAPDPQNVQALQHRHRMHDPHKQAMMMSKRLNLSPDQTAKLEPILVARKQKMDALKADTSLAPNARKVQFRSIHEETKQQLAGVLTQNQLEQMRAMRHHHGQHGQVGPAEAPPTA